jgi:hypothetical protein
MSTPLDLYPVPYTTPQAEGLYLDVPSVSERSDILTSKTGIDVRDVFLGHPRCVVCGHSAPYALQYCQIISHLDYEVVRPSVIEPTSWTTYLLFSGRC